MPENNEENDAILAVVIALIIAAIAICAIVERMHG